MEAREAPAIGSPRVKEGRSRLERCTPKLLPPTFERGLWLSAEALSPGAEGRGLPSLPQDLGGEALPDLDLGELLRVWGLLGLLGGVWGLPAGLFCELWDGGLASLAVTPVAVGGPPFGTALGLGGWSDLRLLPLEIILDPTDLVLTNLAHLPL